MLYCISFTFCSGKSAQGWELPKKGGNWLGVKRETGNRMLMVTPPPIPLESQDVSELVTLIDLLVS